jgi:inosine-uridine nucleoside N-ribohydrolase
VPLEPTLSESARVARLEPPDGEPSVVLDTDTDNEIDDQFAVALALGGAVDLRALYAAPFHNDRSEGPGDGMRKSRAELDRLLDRAGRNVPAFDGSESYLPGPETPVESDAAGDIVERAHATEEPLYVVAIGTPTNVASAVLRDPSIREEVVVVWLGGQPHDWHTAREFNLRQDPHATRVLFGSGVPLVHVPCKNVAEHVKTTVPELRAHLGNTELGEYLAETFARCRGAGEAWWAKVVWDLAAVAWVADPSLVPSHLASAPRLSDDLRWGRDDTRHLVRAAHDADRDGVFRTLADAL